MTLQVLRQYFPEEALIFHVIEEEIRLVDAAAKLIHQVSYNLCRSIVSKGLLALLEGASSHHSAPVIIAMLSLSQNYHP